jgi:hypothetical protein
MGVAKDELPQERRETRSLISRMIPYLKGTVTRPGRRW